MGTLQRASPPPQAPKDWSHRKAEWVCSHCQTHNFTTKMYCRRCKQAYASGMKLIAAGAPPPLVVRQPIGPSNKPNESNKPPSEVAPTSVQAAELALEAARKAAAPQEVLSQWESEVQRRKTAEDTKVPPSLRSRLATATAEANSAMQVRERAEKQL